MCALGLCPSGQRLATAYKTQQFDQMNGKDSAQDPTEILEDPIHTCRIL